MKTFITLILTLSLAGCLPLAVGYVGYKIADSNTESARVQAQVEREKLAWEREKVGK